MRHLCHTLASSVAPNSERHCEGVERTSRFFGEFSSNNGMMGAGSVFQERYVVSDYRRV